MDAHRFEFFSPHSEAELEQTRLLLLEYASELKVDLCFQGFERELRELPGSYGGSGGGLLLARLDDQIAGCCAFRTLRAAGHNGACEMKRLYVRPGYRGLGLGRQLVKHTLDAACRKGFSSVLLDTLDGMEKAQALYQSLGFFEVPAYYQNPIRGARYLKAWLAAPIAQKP